MPSDPKKNASDADRALRKNQRKTLRRVILKEGMDPNGLMYRAIEVSAPETLRLLIELGASVGPLWIGGRSALHEAVSSDRSDRVDLCRVLVAAGADPLLVAVNSMRKPGDQERDTPFQRACRWYRVDLMRFFVTECDIDPTAVRTEEGKLLFKTVRPESRELMLALKIESKVAEEMPDAVADDGVSRSRGASPL
jgi:hypothetical protein